MSREDDAARPRNWGSIAVALGLILVGVGIVAGLAYADHTADTRAAYEQLSNNCESLANETVIVDGGLGAESRELNQSAVQRCRNTSYAEYRQERTTSMWAAPIRPLQWVMYGGVGAAMAALGAIVFRQEYVR